jgi:hypothetical protein
VTLGGGTRLRWAGADDYPAIRALAMGWFPAETLIEPVLYRRLLATGTARVRLLEGQAGASGYYALWPLTAAAYDALSRGERRERDLGAADIVAPHDARANVLYISDVCMAPGAPGAARGAAAGHVLLRDLRRSLADLACAYRHIARVAAWAFSPQGVRLAQRLGLRPVAHNPALMENMTAALRSRLAPAPVDTTGPTQGRRG